MEHVGHNIRDIVQHWINKDSSKKKKNDKNPLVNHKYFMWNLQVSHTYCKENEGQSGIKIWPQFNTICRSLMLPSHGTARVVLAAAFVH